MSKTATIQTTRVYNVIDQAVKDGYTTISEQGGSRSGKTYNTLIWLIIYCIEHPKTTLSIVRKTLPSIKGSVLRDFKEILINIGIYNDKRLNKTDLIYTLPNDSIVEFFSTDDEQKIRGRKRNVLYVNEANEIRQIEYEQLKMRTTHFAVLDYNPSFSDSHWLNALNRDEKTYHFITTYKDNPFLEQTIIDHIEGYKETNLSLWKIYGEGQQAMVEGLIYPVIFEIDIIPHYAEKRAIGLDFGFTNSSTAGVECAVYENNLYLNELFYATHMSNEDIIKELKQYNHLEIIADSEDPRVIDAVKKAGLNIKPVLKAKKSVIGGINKAQSYKIHVTKNSSNIIKDFKNYVWQQNKDGAFENVPVKDFDHSMDAFRYYVIYKLMDNMGSGIRSGGLASFRSRNK